MMKKNTNEIKNTSHSKYRCQYHIVFAPKYRRKEVYGQLRQDIGEKLRKLCEQNSVETIEAEAAVLWYNICMNQYKFNQQYYRPIQKKIPVNLEKIMKFLIQYTRLIKSRSKLTYTNILPGKEAKQVAQDLTP